MIRDVLDDFIDLVKKVALSALSSQYSVSGRFVKKRLGITSFELGRLAREVEMGKVPGVRVVRQGRRGRIRFVIKRDYWLQSNNELEEDCKEQ